MMLRSAEDGDGGQVRVPDTSTAAAVGAALEKPSDAAPNEGYAKIA
jgi:hypothetical protein